jgi:hypothetical protein
MYYYLCLLLFRLYEKNRKLKYFQIINECVYFDVFDNTFKDYNIYNMDVDIFLKS